VDVLAAAYGANKIAWCRSRVGPSGSVRFLDARRAEAKGMLLDPF
jgi:hypothetical protein